MGSWKTLGNVLFTKFVEVLQHQGLLEEHQARDNETYKTEGRLTQILNQLEHHKGNYPLLLL
jgi:hypothetical protein